MINILWLKCLGHLRSEMKTNMLKTGLGKGDTSIQSNGSPSSHLKPASTSCCPIANFMMNVVWVHRLWNNYSPSVDDQGLSNHSYYRDHTFLCLRCDRPILTPSPSYEFILLFCFGTIRVESWEILMKLRLMRRFLACGGAPDKREGGLLKLPASTEIILAVSL